MSNQCDPSNLGRRRLSYTVVACERCRRRKSKCSGGQPCDRCRNIKSLCHYPRTTRFHTGSQGSADTDTAPGTKDLTTPRSQKPKSFVSFTGTGSTASSVLLRPGSFDYYLRLVESNLGTTRPDQPDEPPVNARASFVGAERMRHVIRHRNSESHEGALAAFELEVWSVVLQLYDEEIGLQNPFLDTNQLYHDIHVAKQHATSLGTQSTGSQHSHTADAALLVFAVLSNLKDPNTVEVADPVIEEIFGRVLIETHFKSIDKDSLVLLILTSIYFFLTDREVLAWRGIGTVLRLLQELSCPDFEGQLNHIDDKLYWTAYVLDRRWSFGTGLPFAVSDADITRKLHLSDESLSSKYLQQMVSYCEIASEVRQLVVNNSPSIPTPVSTRDFLHFRVLQWQQHLPASLHFRGVSDEFKPAKEKRGEYKLRLLLYLRANQMRTVILRKCATRSGPSTFDLSTAHSLAEITRDTIQILVMLVRETDIYHTQHKTFNHFLETALSSLLLILCSPGMSQQFPSCARDVLVGMELVRQLATTSPISRRLGDKLQSIHKSFFDANPQLFTSLRTDIDRDLQQNGEQSQTALMPNESTLSMNMQGQQPTAANATNTSVTTRLGAMTSSSLRQSINTTADAETPMITVAAVNPSAAAPDLDAYLQPISSERAPLESPPLLTSTLGSSHVFDVPLGSIPPVGDMGLPISIDLFGSDETGEGLDIGYFIPPELAEMLKSQDLFSF